MQSPHAARLLRYCAGGPTVLLSFVLFHCRLWAGIAWLVLLRGTALLRTGMLLFKFYTLVARKKKEKKDGNSKTHLFLLDYSSMEKIDYSTTKTTRLKH